MGGFCLIPTLPFPCPNTPLGEGEGVRPAPIKKPTRCLGWAGQTCQVFETWQVYIIRA